MVMFAQDFRTIIEKVVLFFSLVDAMLVDIFYKNLNLSNRFCFLNKHKSDWANLLQKINSFFLIKGY